MLETDGCSTQAAGPLPTRSSFWESYASWVQRKGAADATDQVPTRRCAGLDGGDYRQTIVIEGNNFGSSAIGTPIRVTMKRKVCDCLFGLDGSAVPCMNLKIFLALQRSSNKYLPKDFEDCQTSNEFEQTRELEIQT